MPYFDSGRGQIQRGSVHPTRRQGSLCHTVKVAYKKATTHREIKIIFISKTYLEETTPRVASLNQTARQNEMEKRPPKPIRVQQKPSEANRSHPRPSEAIRGRQRLQTKRWQGCRKMYISTMQLLLILM